MKLEHDQVRLGIECPRDIPVHREEVIEAGSGWECESGTTRTDPGGGGMGASAGRFKNGFSGSQRPSLMNTVIPVPVLTAISG